MQHGRLLTCTKGLQRTVGRSIFHFTFFSIDRTHLRFLTSNPHIFGSCVLKHIFYSCFLFFSFKINETAAHSSHLTPRNGCWHWNIVNNHKCWLKSISQRCLTLDLRLYGIYGFKQPNLNRIQCILCHPIYDDDYFSTKKQWQIIANFISYALWLSSSIEWFEYNIWRRCFPSLDDLVWNKSAHVFSVLEMEMEMVIIAILSPNISHVLSQKLIFFATFVKILLWIHSDALLFDFFFFFRCCIFRIKEWLWKVLRTMKSDGIRSSKMEF